MKTKKTLAWWQIGLLLILIWDFLTVKKLLDFSTYPTNTYYQQFYRLSSGKISKADYDNSFNWLVQDNKQAATIIQNLGIQKMFIWGTNPMLYAQTQTLPTSRFTVSFHIKDFNDYEKTFQQIQTEKPKLIIVMKDETTPFPQLEKLLAEKYIANHKLQTMTLYLRYEKE